MRKLALHFDKEFQGNFERKKLNILLVFQVNCPGCFFYALPLMQSLYHQYRNQEIGFLALSTAFEDFDQNTDMHTKALLEEGLLIGETKKSLAAHGIDALPFKIDFPVAMDKVADSADQLNGLVDKICQINIEFDSWAEVEQQSMKMRIVDYLKRLDKVSLTFTGNQFRGTPTFVLFNEHEEILKSWFGHIDQSTIESNIRHFQGDDRIEPN